tara:strand:- start:1364 stop:2323 length:960 start_codon:yes stop_codon:yes gene_type:complete
MKLSIVISAIGSKVDIFLAPLLKSINAIYPNIEIKIIGKDVPNANENLMKVLKDNYSCVRVSPGILKNISWLQGLEIANSEWVLFLDADTLLLKPIDSYLEWCEKNKVEWLFTWRDYLPYWQNNGVKLIKKNENTLNFYRKLVSRGIENIKISKTGQYTFQELMDLDNQQVSEIVNCKDKDKRFIFDKHNIKFGAVSCYYMNNIYTKKPLNDEIFILHYKSLLGMLILKDTKLNRYRNFLKYEIFDYKVDTLKNVNSRLELWKNFAPPDTAENIIDVLVHYKKMISNDRGFFKAKRILSHFFIRFRNKVNNLISYSPDY